jgi:hypothetical protein
VGGGGKGDALDHVVVLLDDVFQQEKISLIGIPDAGGVHGVVVDQHLNTAHTAHSHQQHMHAL